MITLQSFIQNLPGLMATVSSKEYDEFRVARLINRQILLHRMSVQERRIVKMVYVWDLRGFAMKTLKRLKSKAAQDYFGTFDEEQKDAFPEIVAKIVCVNVPWFLSLMWTAGKRILPKRTLQKIVVSQKPGAKRVQSVISPENLPPALGGTCREFEADFPLVSNTNGEEMQTKVVVPRSSARAHKIPISRTDAGRTLTYGIQLQSQTLRFSAAMKTTRGDVIIQEPCTLQSDIFFQGKADIPKDGYDSDGMIVLELRFDNSFSWLREKQVELFASLNDE